MLEILVRICFIRRYCSWEAEFLASVALCFVLPQDQKQVVLALAAAYVGDTSPVPLEDVVQGKGQGSNILLQYEPETGL